MWNSYTRYCRYHIGHYYWHAHIMSYGACFRWIRKIRYRFRSRFDKERLTSFYFIYPFYFDIFFDVVLYFHNRHIRETINVTCGFYTGHFNVLWEIREKRYSRNRKENPEKSYFGPIPRRAWISNINGRNHGRHKIPWEATLSSPFYGINSRGILSAGLVSREALCDR